jgi:hypothetical protein
VIPRISLRQALAAWLALSSGLVWDGGHERITSRVYPSVRSPTRHALATSRSWHAVRYRPAIQKDCCVRMHRQLNSAHLSPGI